MADDYTVGLRIAVNRGKPESMVVSEEKSFPDLSFAKMTHISAEFYELLAKLAKEIK
jgi:hypothetical protein